MPFTLKSLPFARDSLIPYISEETIDYHHGKHHSTYVKNLNGLVAGTDFERKSLVEIIRSAESTTFNNAAQVWNHDFYWDCLIAARDSGEPMKELTIAMEQSFGGLEAFKDLFTKAALGLFGSGWVWLVKKNGTMDLSIVTTSNAATPIASVDSIPLLTCDIWEHAYYIDYRNVRSNYMEAFWQLVNWEFVSRNFIANAFRSVS